MGPKDFVLTVETLETIHSLIHSRCIYEAPTMCQVQILGIH